jgi:hypothetical protein
MPGSVGLVGVDLDNEPRFGPEDIEGVRAEWHVEVRLRDPVRVEPPRELLLRPPSGLRSLDATTKAGCAAGAGAALQIRLQLRDARQALGGRLRHEPLDRLAESREVEQRPLDARCAQPFSDHHFVAFEGH